MGRSIWANVSRSSCFWRTSCNNFHVSIILCQYIQNNPRIQASSIYISYQTTQSTFNYRLPNLRPNLPLLPRIYPRIHGDPELRKSNQFTPFASCLLDKVTGFLDSSREVEVAAFCLDGCYADSRRSLSMLGCHLRRQKFDLELCCS